MKFTENDRESLVTKISSHIHNCEGCKYRISREDLAKHLKVKNTGHLGWGLDELVKQRKLTKIKVANRWYYYVRKS